jgi:beta-hydroxylase
MGLASAAVEAVLRVDQRLLERRHPRVDAPLDPATQPWITPLEAGFEDIRAELDELLAAGVRFPETSEIVGRDQGNEGRWSTYMLCAYGTWLAGNGARVPRTTELVRQVPGVQIAGFAVLHGGTHLPRHRGPSKALRYHLGIRVPGPPGACRITVGDRTHEWADGRSLLFDDSVEHEAWNDTDEDRYVLFVERPWGASGLTGVVDRAAQGLLRLAARDVPGRAVELDLALNP